MQRTQRLPREMAPVKPSTFAAELIARLEKLKREQDTFNSLEERLQQIQEVCNHHVPVYLTFILIQSGCKTATIHDVCQINHSALAPSSRAHTSRTSSHSIIACWKASFEAGPQGSSSPECLTSFNLFKPCDPWSSNSVTFRHLIGLFSHACGTDKKKHWVY